MQSRCAGTAAATLRVERQETELATSNRVVELRAMLVNRHHAVHWHFFLASLSLGEEPDPLPEPDVHGEFVLRYVRARPGTVARLLSLCDAAAVASDAKDASSGLRLVMFRQEYGSGGLDFSKFLEVFAAEVKARALYREKASRFRAAAATARSALRAHIDDALGNLGLGLEHSDEGCHVEGRLNERAGRRDHIAVALTMSKPWHVMRRGFGFRWAWID